MSQIKSSHKKAKSIKSSRKSEEDLENIQRPSSPTSNVLHSATKPLTTGKKGKKIDFDSSNESLSFTPTKLTFEETKTKPLSQESTKKIDFTSLKNLNNDLADERNSAKKEKKGKIEVTDIPIIENKKRRESFEISSSFPPITDEEFEQEDGETFERDPEIEELKEDLVAEEEVDTKESKDVEDEDEEDEEVEEMKEIEENEINEHVEKEEQEEIEKEQVQLEENQTKEVDEKIQECNQNQESDQMETEDQKEDIEEEDKEESRRTRRVTFGPELRPCLIDKDLPPSTPVRKGQKPMMVTPIIKFDFSVDKETTPPKAQSLTASKVPRRKSFTPMRQTTDHKIEKRKSFCTFNPLTKVYTHLGSKSATKPSSNFIRVEPIDEPFTSPSVRFNFFLFLFCFF